MKNYELKKHEGFQELLEKQRFAGYSVPEELKEIAELILFRFNINGSCDSMYIANVIAYEAGLGDGCSNFFDKPFHIDAECAKRAAKALCGAYGCNILKDDQEELQDIILDRRIYLEKTLEGLFELKKATKEWMKRYDLYRKEYAGRCIKEIDRKRRFLKNLTKTA